MKKILILTLLLPVCSLLSGCTIGDFHKEYYCRIDNNIAGFYSPKSSLCKMPEFADSVPKSLRDEVKKEYDACLEREKRFTEAYKDGKCEEVVKKTSNTKGKKCSGKYLKKNGYKVIESCIIYKNK